MTQSSESVESTELSTTRHCAIVVPYRDRRDQLDLFLERVPAYLKSQGITEFKIIIAEQAAGGVFSIAACRNVGAAWALSAGPCDYLVFQDVDMLPIDNVDYGYPDRNTIWFMNAGSCKVQCDAFQRCNGYNPSFVGWGFEDTEFYERLELYGYETLYWPETPLARRASMYNLDGPPELSENPRAFSERYFGHSPCPQFLPFGSKPSAQSDRSNYDIAAMTSRNLRILEWLRRLPTPLRREYSELHGLNQINLAHVTVERNESTLAWLTFQPDRVTLPSE